jgi:hypothetical protein
MHRPIYVFYHLYQAHRWEQLFLEQMGALFTSGLAEEAQDVCICVNGDKPLPKARDCIVWRHHGNDHERATLLDIQELAKEEPDARIFYFHSKGISHPTRNQDDWRMLMQHFLIAGWREAIKLLDGNDIVTVNWRTHPVPHPSGNFWWANASFLASLDPAFLDPNDRTTNEFWLGSQPSSVACLHESGIEHYTHEYPPSRYCDSFFSPAPLSMTPSATLGIAHELAEATDASSIDAILVKRGIGSFDCDGGTDKQDLHSYGPVYETLLQPLMVGGESAAILEVGVQYGGSMLLWNDLCPSAKVIGVEIENKVHPSIFDRLDASRCSLLVGDAYTEAMVERVKEEAPDGLDFAIDDGPHTLESQQQFLLFYLPLLKPNGIAVIEDIQDYSWMAMLAPFVGEGFTCEVVDRRKIKGRYDDLMLIVYRDERQAEAG